MFEQVAATSRHVLMSARAIRRRVLTWPWDELDRAVLVSARAIRRRVSTWRGGSEPPMSAACVCVCVCVNW